MSNAQAFPCSSGTGGLTKREYFAALAMQGMLANSGREASDEAFAIASVNLADALLEALSTKPV